MTAMTVAYVQRTGLAVGALTTTVPSTEVSLDGLGSLELPVRSGQTASTGAATPAVTFTVVRFDVSDLAILTSDAEFSNPADVFEWRVLTTRMPDGSYERRLDRLVDAGITVNYTGPGPKEIKVTVPRLGSAERLNLEIRDRSARVVTQTLTFSPLDGQKTLTVTLPGETPLVVIVEGYVPSLVDRRPP